MPEHIHRFSAPVRGGEAIYEAHVLGDRRSDGTWCGWLEFRPVGQSGRPLRTGQETSQPNRWALDYWAGGLEPVYLEGALTRARAD